MSSSNQHEFFCRDDLWSRVELLAERRGLTPDQVLEAALVRLFTRQGSARASAEASYTNGKTSNSGLGLLAATDPVETTLPPGRTLYVRFQGRWYTMERDRFVIGRGAKHSDLPIRDANISRQHCEIVREEGEFHIRDLGSTNGVEYEGRRVDDFRIEEGMRVHLCEHELFFTFNVPSES
ncbi:MAG: FHA domain-containing protein [Nannocystaceae bacterium]